jgi:hypothetical protein
MDESKVATDLESQLNRAFRRYLNSADQPHSIVGFYEWLQRTDELLFVRSEGNDVLRYARNVLSRTVT